MWSVSALKNLYINKKSLKYVHHVNRQVELCKTGMHARLADVKQSIVFQVHLFVCLLAICALLWFYFLDCMSQITEINNVECRIGSYLIHFLLYDGCIGPSSWVL